MPRIRRWFPISHGFNRDPQVREMRRVYGDWMGYVWQEMCAIADLNDGVIKGEMGQIAESLSYISLTNRPSLSAKRINDAFTFMAKCGWIEVQTGAILVVKYSEYHRTREPIKSHAGTNDAPSEPSEPSDPFYKNKKKENINKRKTSFPENFTLSEGLKEWAKKSSLPEPEPEFEAFRDYHVAKGSTFLDWEAAFRTWLRNTKKFGRGGQHKIANAPTIADKIRQRTRETLVRGLSPEEAKRVREKYGFGGADD